MAKQKKLDKKDDRRLFAFLGVLLTIIGFIIALILKKDDKYVMYYAKQGLMLFIGQIIIGVINLIPFIGNGFIVAALWVIWVIVWIIAWIHALSGEMKPLILFGELADKINI